MPSRFELNTLVVAQLKEKLHKFNLPTIPVLTEDTVLYNGRTYIDNDKVVKYINNSFETLMPYKYNVEIINMTKNFIMKSSIYDQYTHEYLGNYLRFLRDYKKLNLMGMYNCFFGDELVNVSTSIELPTGAKFSINTYDSNYKYYIVPVKLNNYYTIAIDSCYPYELACIIHNNTYVSTDESKELSRSTYKKIPGSMFNRPFILNTYFNNAEQFWKKENDIKLLIKIPKKIKTSITILEGNWVECSNIIDSVLTTNYIYDDKNVPVTLLSKNSLLKANNLNSYPFSDRLVEYILCNVIDSTDTIYENIERVQNDFYIQRLGYINGWPGIWSDVLRSDLYKECYKPDITKGGKRYSHNIVKYNLDNEVESSERYRYRFIDIYDDVTGYVDKDLETLTKINTKG